MDPLGFSLAAHAHLAVNILDAKSVLATFGVVGVAVVLFVETGLLVGFFLPGDSLLFTAGLLCASGAGGIRLSTAPVMIAAVVGALAGAQVGYWIGRRGGRALLARRQTGRLRDGADRAEELLARYGYAKAIVLARFIPVVRTVLNPLAGALGVPPRIFALWQAVGGVVWTIGLVIAGYALGSVIPDVDHYLLPLVVVIVVLSLIPLAREILRGRRTQRGSPGRREEHTVDEAP